MASFLSLGASLSRSALSRSALSRSALSRNALSHRRYARGFTLTEIMIVVVIVGILAAIAYPSYQDQVIRSRRADGQAALMSLAQAQERYMARCGGYATSIAGDSDCDEEGLGRATESPEGYYALSLEDGATTTRFTLIATAVAPQSADTDCPALTLTNTGIRDTTGDGDCW
ncbi:type IV pilin protein [Cobetia sp. 3AK]|uniref:type IV pilin protein n=2 Tax=Halomonadaceae TaxID=28256 RepID=UPI0024471E84|nr:type IV pilin protein [Cobetia sp. 3AK]MDH2375151.1 type IV pilin protein [Cobetia sp. 3AK]